MLEIGLDLLAEGFQRVELLFAADELEGLDFEVSAVDILVDVEVMGFEAVGWGGLVVGGADAEVEDGGVGFVVENGVGGVDAEGWEGEILDIEVGGGETDLAAELVALDDLTGDGVGTTEQAAGFREQPGGDFFADDGGADGAGVQGDGGEDMGGVMEFAFEVFKELAGARALMSEGEALSDADGGKGVEVLGDLADESFSVDLAERVGEGGNDGGVDAGRFERLESGLEVLDGWGDAVWGDHVIGVLIEGQGGGEAVIAVGVIEGELEELLMAEVDAIEHADGDVDGLR